ncbi:hypothetical protein SAMN05660461_5312 [Chitinophaga ginsengisegetis]|uniref:Uncharacterized protein n=1 Tax=Chitinophaga ginsengisegetis TaxID=393003 RepID=A0A1T5P9K6_9BACT|nr:hypothetical protein [Chitinophaga ginsengisegetis]SKD09424.1 hypothetical protein SAMN05660461_5312 [Chitinophaga ginsengisegetis]
MKTKFHKSQLLAIEATLSKCFPPAPLSENELHDSYTRLCNFPIYIKEYLRRELGWTDSQFSQFVMPPLGGRNVKATKQEIAVARVIIKNQLKLLLQYLDVSPGLICTKAQEFQNQTADL